MTTNYTGETQYYKDKLKQGEQYQDFVMEHLRSIGFIIQNYSSKQFQYKNGENPIGWEIKFDSLFRKTNNIYIETHEKSNPNNREYVKSGIYRDRAWLLLIGDYETLHIFSTKQLLRLYENKELHEKQNIICKITETSQGMLLPRNSIAFQKLILYQYEFTTNLLFNKETMTSTYKVVNPK